MSVGWGQDCIDGVEVELWGECYNIEETISLNLSNQGLNGQIPPEIGNLENLMMLDLSNVGLNGQIPPEIGNLESLRIIDLGHNQLTGQIPIQIGNLTNLEYLGFNHNQLIGEIPSEIGNLTNLIHIRLNYNQLTGEVPSEIGNLVNLEILKLYNNQFNFVSDSICNLTNLFWSFGNYGNYDSNIYNNNLCPPYPECIEPYIGYQDTSECEEPSLCDEGYTEINGECYYQSDLDVLQQFIDNSQEGENPPPSDLSPVELGVQVWEDGRLIAFCSTNEVTFTCYTEFSLSGEIPTEIGNLTQLKSLQLPFNELNGEIPAEIGNLMQLISLGVRHNQLSGEIPSEIGTLDSLMFLDLSFNQLSGLIPQTLCSLNIWGNFFYLHDNNFCPPYPECLPEEYIGYQDTTNCEPECDLGDINCDGDLNVLDVVLMVNMILTAEYDEISDINQDGLINILDVVQLVNIILGVTQNTINDIDGNVYETVQIGGQLWMAENLTVTHYNNGDEIPNITNNSDWGVLFTGAYCDYDNNPTNSGTYGRIYNWYTIDDDRGVCPDEWHIPSDDEFMELEMFLGMGESETNSTGYRGTDEGSMLADNLNLWNSGILVNNNEFGTSGFSSLPSGYRFVYYGFQNMGNNCSFWSSSEGTFSYAWYRLLDYNYSSVLRTTNSKHNGFSIRCIKD